MTRHLFYFAVRVKVYSGQWIVQFIRSSFGADMGGNEVDLVHFLRCPIEFPFYFSSAYTFLGTLVYIHLYPNYLDCTHLWSYAEP